MSVARSFSCSGKYKRHIEAALAMAFADVRHDIACRADADPRVRRLAPVPDDRIDESESGDLLVLSLIPNDTVEDPAAVLAEAFNTATPSNR